MSEKESVLLTTEHFNKAVKISGTIMEVLKSKTDKVIVAYLALRISCLGLKMISGLEASDENKIDEYIKRELITINRK